MLGIDGIGNKVIQHLNEGVDIAVDGGAALLVIFDNQLVVAAEQLVAHE